MRISKWGVGLLAALLVLLGSALPAGATIATKNSNYWGGYVASGSYVHSFRFVSTSFTVPTPDCSNTPSGETFHFAALGGWGTLTPHNIEGAGVVEGCNGGIPYAYGAIWIGAYPAAGGNANVLQVNPGDYVTASVFYNKTTGQPNFKVADLTQVTAYQQYRACAPTGCGLSTAEVVSDGNTGTWPQGNSDFGSITFDAITVTRYGSAYHATDLVNSAWTTTRLVEIGPVVGLPEFTVGALYNAVNTTPMTSSFTEQWLRQN